MITEVEMEYRKGILFTRIPYTLNKNNYLLTLAKLKEVVKGSGIRYLVINFKELNMSIYDIKFILKNNKMIKENEGQMFLCNQDIGHLNVKNKYLQRSNITAIQREINAFEMFEKGS